MENNWCEQYKTNAQLPTIPGISRWTDMESEAIIQHHQVQSDVSLSFSESQIL